MMEEPFPTSPFFDVLGSFDFYGDNPVEITRVRVPADQWPKELIFIPTLLLLGLIAYLQHARSGRETEGAIA